MVEVLDCTLRDGSYAINYKFTGSDTSLVVTKLEEFGIEKIEIGHGLGLNASKSGYGKAACTDEEYIEAAKKAATSSKIGVFFIPGIGTFKDLYKAKSLGIDFVRIGTNVTEVKKAVPYIAYAKNLGLEVSSNLMKSYAVDTKQFSNASKIAVTAGADALFVVDSAGGMLPKDVRQYVESIRNLKCKIGFHGHNNLSLAAINSMSAIEAGAHIVDGTLRGIGRSAGNTQIELLLLLLNKLGHCFENVDLKGLFQLSEWFVKPLFSRGLDAIEAISGYAQFHSGYFNIIKELAEKHHLDPIDLIMAASTIDKVTVTKQSLETIIPILQEKFD